MSPVFLCSRRSLVISTKRVYIKPQLHSPDEEDLTVKFFMKNVNLLIQVICFLGSWTFSQHAFFER